MEVLTESSSHILLVVLALNLSLGVAAFMLKMKLFPFQNFIHTKKDSDGQVIYQSSPSA